MNGIDYLLDTNVIIGILTRHPDAIGLMDRLGFDFENSAISQITRIELLSSPDVHEEEGRRIEIFLKMCVVFRLDDLIEEETIRLRRRLRLKLPDAVILATASVRGLRLVTLDERLLRRLPEV